MKSKSVLLSVIGDTNEATFVRLSTNIDVYALFSIKTIFFLAKKLRYYGFYLIFANEVTQC